MDFSILGGILLGTITGMIPGVHPNLVAGILVTMPLAKPATLIFATAITHTFLNTIPATYLATPDPESAASAHPMQEYARKGKGHEAILLTLIGSLVALLGTTALIPFVRTFLKKIYPYAEKSIPWMLLYTSMFLINRQKNKRAAAIIFCLSGLLGVVTLQDAIQEPLLPLFTGLFAFPALLLTTNRNANPQIITEPEVTTSSAKTIGQSLFFGSFFSFLPALGPAQAASIQTTVCKNNKKSDFLILVGCLNTVNIVFSVATLLELNRARNGAVAAIQSLGTVTPPEITSLFALGLLLAFPCTVLCILLSRQCAIIKNKINPEAVGKWTIFLLLILIVVLSGGTGLLIVSAATIIGYLPYKYDVNKTTLMGVLMIPTMIFYFGRVF